MDARPRNRSRFRLLWLACAGVAACGPAGRPPEAATPATGESAVAEGHAPAESAAGEVPAGTEPGANASARQAGGPNEAVGEEEAEDLDEPAAEPEAEGAGPQPGDCTPDGYVPTGDETDAEFAAACELQRIGDTPMPPGAPATPEAQEAALRALPPPRDAPEPSVPDGLPLRAAVRGPHRAQVELVRELEADAPGRPRIVAYTWSEMDEWTARARETPDWPTWEKRIEERRRVCEVRVREERRREEEDPEYEADYEERFYDYGDCRIYGQVEAMPGRMGRMPLCRRLMLVALEQAGDGWRVVRRYGPFDGDRCHDAIRKLAWRDLDGDGVQEIVLETRSTTIDVWEIGFDPCDWATALHVIWDDGRVFDLPLGSYSIEDCSNRSVARYEFRRGGAVLHVERGTYESSGGCGRGDEGWPTGEEAETLRDVEAIDLRWDPGRRAWVE